MTVDGLIVVRACRIVPLDGETHFPGALFLASPERVEYLTGARPPFVEVVEDGDPVAVAFRANIAAVTAEERTGRRAEDEPAPVPVFPEPEKPATPKKKAEKLAKGA